MVVVRLYQYFIPSSPPGPTFRAHFHAVDETCSEALDDCQQIVVAWIKDDLPRMLQCRLECSTDTGRHGVDIEERIRSAGVLLAG